MLIVKSPSSGFSILFIKGRYCFVIAGTGCKFCTGQWGNCPACDCTDEKRWEYFLKFDSVKKKWLNFFLVIYCHVSRCPDDNTERPTSAETPPSLAAANAEPVLESKQEVDSQIVLPTELAAQSVAPVATTEVPSTLIKDQQSPPSLPPGATLTTTPAEAVNKVGTTVSDTVDAPHATSQSSEAPEAPVKIEELPAAPAQAEKGPEKEEAKTEEVKKVEKEEQVATTKLEPAAEAAAAGSSNLEEERKNKEEMATKTATEVSQPPPPAREPAGPQTQNAVLRSTPEPESTQVEAAEPVLPNGLPQETEELPKDNAISDTTPHKQPDASQSQESTPMAKTATAAQEVKEEAEEREEEEEECKKKSEDTPPASVSCPEESTMQGTVNPPPCFSGCHMPNLVLSEF